MNMKFSMAAVAVVATSEYGTILNGDSKPTRSD